jgi:hypothetical protein
MLSFEQRTVFELDILPLQKRATFTEIVMNNRFVISCAEYHMIAEPGEPPIGSSSLLAPLRGSGPH